MAVYLLLALSAFALGAGVMHVVHARRAVTAAVSVSGAPAQTQGAELTALAAASMFQLNRSLQTELARSRHEVGTEKQKTRVLALEARTDKLTGLPNRRVFDEQMELHVKQRQSPAHTPVSLILIDVDHFKQINDRYGHSAGDAALQWLAKIAAAQVGDIGLAVRYGGEEFAILAPAVAGNEATALAEKLRRAIAAEPFRHESDVLRITASLGVAAALPGEGSKSLAHRADEALYAAKKNGRNRVYCHNGRGSVPSDATSQPSTSGLKSL